MNNEANYINKNTQGLSEMQNNIGVEEYKRDSNKKQKALLRKIKKLEEIRRNPLNSIVLFYDQYPSYSVFKKTDKILRILKKRIISGTLSVSQVVAVSNLYIDVINKFWNEVSAYYDKLVGIHPSGWLTLNESIQEKQVLVNRENNFVYTPKNDEVCTLLILLKSIRKAKIQFKSSSSYEELIKIEKLQEIENRLTTEIEQINKEVIKNYNITL